MVEKNESHIGDQTNLGINLKWLIQIIIIAGLVVWGYFGLTSKITQLEIEILRMKDNVTQNSEFRIKWPLGELGSLPDDAEQNMRLNFVEQDVARMEKYIDDLRLEAARILGSTEVYRDGSAPNN